jgi:predicted phage terminase large subunit-like protein
MRSFQFPYGADATGQGFFWPASKTKRAEWLEVKRLRPMEAQSVYQCNPGSRVGDIFLASDFDWYLPPVGLEYGRQIPTVAAFLNTGAMLVTGWDTAMSANSTADWTVGVTGMLVPCEVYHRNENPELVGPCDAHYDIYIVDVYREKLDLGDAVAAVREQYIKWNPQTVVIEKRANGTPIIQALANSGIPMEGVDPIDNKRDRVVNARGVGSVQGWFRLHRVKFPVMAEWLEPLLREIKDFTGEKGNQDDQVDALAHMAGHAINEGGLNVRMPSDYMNPAKLQEIMANSHLANDPLSLLLRTQNIELATLRDIGQASDPFGDRCGRCVNFDKVTTMCLEHKKKIPAIHPVCELFNSEDGLNFINWR